MLSAELECSFTARIHAAVLEFCYTMESLIMFPKIESAHLLSFTVLNAISVTFEGQTLDEGDAASSPCSASRAAMSKRGVFLFSISHGTAAACAVPAVLKQYSGAV